MFESGWLCHEHQRPLWDLTAKAKNKRHHQYYNRHTVTNRIVKEKANVFFQVWVQVRKFQTVHDELILDEMMSSVIELYVDQASLYGQDLQIEESSTEIFTSMNGVFRGEFTARSPTSLSRSQDEPGSHSHSPGRPGGMTSSALPPPQSCKSQGHFSAAHGGTSVRRCPPRWSLREHLWQCGSGPWGEAERGQRHGVRQVRQKKQACATINILQTNDIFQSLTLTGTNQLQWSGWCHQLASLRMSALWSWWPIQLEGFPPPQY